MGVIDKIPELRQFELRQNLEKKLDEVTEITNKFIANPISLKSEILPYLSRDITSVEAFLLGNALDISHKYYTIGDHALRDNGDPFISHPISTAVIANSFNSDIHSKIIALFHDLFENNQDLKEKIKQEMKENNFSWAIPYISTLTPPEFLTDSKQKKDYIKKRIIETAGNDPEKQILLYGQRGFDRLHNLLTIDGMVAKDERSSEERKQGQFYDTKKNVLQFAKEFDNISNSELKLHPYLSDLIGLSETSNYLSILKDIMNTGLKYLQKPKPMLIPVE